MSRVKAFKGERKSEISGTISIHYLFPWDSFYFKRQFERVILPYPMFFNWGIFILPRWSFFPFSLSIFSIKSPFPPIIITIKENIALFVCRLNFNNPMMSAAVNKCLRGSFSFVRSHFLSVLRNRSFSAQKAKKRKVYCVVGSSIGKEMFTLTDESWRKGQNKTEVNENKDFWDWKGRGEWDEGVGRDFDFRPVTSPLLFVHFPIFLKPCFSSPLRGILETASE